MRKYPITLSAIIVMLFGIPAMIVGGASLADADSPEDSPGGVIVEQLPNGKKVYCVAWKTAQGVSIDCNWEGFNKMGLGGGKEK